MNFWLFQALGGLSFAMLLFLLSAGLSLIFGLMKILNLAHGSFYLLSAYIGLSILKHTNSFLLAAVISFLVVPIIGVLIQRFFLSRFHLMELPQVLLTFGFIFIIGDICLWIWGGLPQALPKPEPFSHSIHFLGLVFPSYRILVIVVGLLVAVGLWLFLDKTKVGSLVRAGVDDQEMARCVGVNVKMLFTGVFAVGCLLAALAGILGGPFVGVYPGVDIDILLYACVVVIVGGVGSLKGAFVGSLVIGMLDNFGKALFPEMSLFAIFLPMAIILAVRPKGLFGKE